MVNLYQLYFSSSHFLSQPNKRVFHPSTFPPFQLHTNEGKLNLFYHHFSILPQFSIFPLFHPPNQTDSKREGGVFKKRILTDFSKT